MCSNWYTRYIFRIGYSVHFYRIPTGKPGKIGKHSPSQGILNRLEKLWKITQNTGKVREFQTNIICYFSVIFKWTVHYVLDWIKVSVKMQNIKKLLENWEKKCWKSRGILSVRKSGNHVWYTHFLFGIGYCPAGMVCSLLGHFFFPGFVVPLTDRYTGELCPSGFQLTRNLPTSTQCFPWKTWSSWVLLTQTGPRLVDFRFWGRKCSELPFSQWNWLRATAQELIYCWKSWIGSKSWNYNE